MDYSDYNTELIRAYEASVREIVERINFARFPIRIDIQVRGLTACVADIVMSMHVRDRETGGPTTVSCRCSVPSGPEQDVVRGIFGQIQTLIMHEVKEAFLYDGKRIYDPHPALFVDFKP